jgi:hypothetical protein
MERSLIVVFACLIGVAALAATAFSAGPAATGKTVAQLRADAEQLVLQQAEMAWKTWALGEASDQDALYRQYTYLFTRDSIDKVKAAGAQETNPEQRLALAFFLHYLETEYIGAQTAQLWDIDADLQANESVLVNGQMIPYHNLSKLLADEPDPAKRAVMAKEEVRIYRLLNEVVRKRIFETSHHLATDLGYKDYLELSVAYRMFDLNDLYAKAQQFLDQSEAMYLKLFDEVSPIPRKDFHRSDVGRLLAKKEYDAYFPADSLLATAYATFDGMGLGEHARKKIFVNSEPLPKKNPRAVCFPIRVPNDVRLSIKPIGGDNDYKALFHEFGHAQHFSHGTTPVWEFQQLGSNAVTEGYAYTFESLPEREAWLVKHTTMPPDVRRKFHRHVMLANLYMARRYMAKLIFETEFHRGVPDPQKRYQYWLSKAYGFQLTDDESTRYLTDLDPFLYCADYVQAFHIEAMLNEHLTRDFGAVWWENPKSGAFLTQYWSVANKLSGAELAQMLGYKSYDNKLLLAYLTGGK